MKYFVQLVDVEEGCWSQEHICGINVSDFFQHNDPF